MLELIETIVTNLELARAEAIKADDLVIRCLMSDMIGRLEAHRPDLEGKYGSPDKQIVRVEVECSEHVSCASRDDLINLLTGIENGCVDGNVTFVNCEG